MMDLGLSLNVLAIFVLTVVLYFLVRKKQRLPPGPWGLPVLGYYPFLGKEPDKTVDELGRKYGAVLGLRIGPQYVVILNDWHAMVEAYKLDTTLDRPDTVFGFVPFHFGVGGANGEEWLHFRRLMMKSFKSIGLHSTRWEELIKEDAAEVVRDIASRGPGPIELKRFLDKRFVNSIMTLALGHHLPEDHPLLEVVTKGVDDVLAKSPTLNLFNFSPLLMKLMQALGVEEKLNIQDVLENFIKYVTTTTEENLKTASEDIDGSFVKLFYQGLKDLYHNAMDEEYIKNTISGNVQSLLIGGSETTRSTLLNLLAAMAEHQDQQRRVHEELDRIIGQDGHLYWSDRTRVPYTHAAILESMRWRTLAPKPGMRIATDDIHVQGYDIPKGTFIVLNLSLIHRDVNYWAEPEKFILDRFLTDDGKKVVSDLKSYAPFSFGKRNCPGKLIAYLEIFQYFVTLMQKFKVIPRNGEKSVKYKHTKGLTHAPYDMELCFIPRQ